MKNNYPGKCTSCGVAVAVGAGTVSKVEGSWRTWCAAHSAPADTGPMRIRLSMRPDGRVKIAPTAYLGERFNAFREALAEGGAAFESKSRENYTTPQALAGVIAALEKAGFVVDAEESVRANLAALRDARVREMDAAADRIDAIERRTGWKFYRFQREGIGFLSARRGAVLADDMGLGKTAQVLGALPDGVRAIVVSPNSAKGTWRREIGRIRPDLRVRVVSGGKEPISWPEPGEVLIVNYDVLGKVTAALGPAPEGVALVADEAHRLLNPKSARSVAFAALAGRVRATATGKTWIVTATPTLGKNLWGFYGLLELADVAVEAFGGTGGFIRLFGGEKDSWGGWSWRLDSVDEVGDALRGVLLRRMKRDLPDLPGKTREDLDVEVKVTPELRKAMKGLEKRLAENGISLDDYLAKAVSGGCRIAFEEFSRVRTALAAAKIPALLELVEDLEEVGEPVVVFSEHRAPVDLLGERAGWATITGDTKPEERTFIEEEFQAGRYRGIAATIEAGGTALTLTRSSRVIFVDRTFVPLLNDQAEDRCNRIGSTKNLLVTNLVADHPVDRRLAEILAEKRRIFDGSVGAAAISIDAPVETIPLPRIPDAPPAPAPTPAVPPAPTRRAAANFVEEWAEAGIRQLAADDPDYVSEVNGIGFSKMDADFGHSLARALDGGLTEKQWEAAVKLATRYRRQVGDPPAP